MKIIGVIPARYASTRFPGKPLADIHGKPMIWWVYNQVKKVSGLSEVYIATDDKRIADVCEQRNMSFVMTNPDCNTSTERVYEVSRSIDSDIYICVNGDEPLIDPNVIAEILPNSLDGFYAANLMTAIKNPVEVVDTTNIKVAVDVFGNAVFMSRSPIPYPKAGMNFVYRKHIGVLAYCKEALKFFAETPKGQNENIEDINELRFIENGKKLRMIEVDTEILSVDNKKDLEYVCDIVAQRIKKGEILM